MMRRFLLLSCFLVVWFVFLSSTVQAETVFKARLLDSPDGVYRTAYMEAQFFISLNNISLVIRNTSPDPIDLVWDEMALVDNHQISHRVVHSGVRVIHVALSQPPTTIAPNSSYSDTVYAADLINDSGTSWDFIRAASPGEEVALVLAVRQGSNVHRDTVRFRIEQYATLHLKSPFLAGTLSFFLPSIGHLYAGNWLRGLAFGVPRIALTLWMANQETSNPDRVPSTLDTIIGVGYLVLIGAEVYDSVKLVNETNAKARASIAFDPTRKQVAVIYTF